MANFQVKIEWSISSSGSQFVEVEAETQAAADELVSINPDAFYDYLGVMDKAACDLELRVVRRPRENNHFHYILDSPGGNQ